ncbi:MAG: peptide-methionine (S)-S-oxide reductase [Nanobdellota archaeon]
MKHSCHGSIVAGGWCIEAAFDGHKGAIEAVSGYTGGTTKDPTYETVSTGETGHYKVTYDPQKVSYDELDIFWKHIDPTQEDGQFADKGSIRPQSSTPPSPKKKIAEHSRARIARILGKVATRILPAQEFYPAKDYHPGY